MLNGRVGRLHRALGAGALLVLVLLLGDGSSRAAQTAPWVRGSIVTNGGGNRLDAVVQVATARPGRPCRATVRYGGRTAKLPVLRTDATGGRQWHWVIGDGAPKARMVVRVRCRFPDGKHRTRSVSATVGPGAFPRRRFRQVVQGLVREEKWTPPKRYDGSGGGAHLYPSEQCTWYVAQRRPDLPYFPGRSGDAKNWLASAQRAGLPTGQSPAVGAVAVFRPGQYGAGFFGHVAFVTAVRGDRIEVAEANFGRAKPGSARQLPWAGLRFIYGEKPPEPPVRVVPPAPDATPAPPVGGPTPPPVWPTVDLLSAPTLQLVGAGTAVARAGDVNGDGVDDVLVSDGMATANGRELSGSIWVVFGRPGWAGHTGLWDLGGAGFRIDGAEAGDQAGRSVAAAGDVNGDGFSDVLVGAPMASPAGRPSAGSAYVVFGKPGGEPVDLQDVGARGYRIDGGEPYELTGWAVSGAGDVNRDGRPDLIVTAVADKNGRPSSGSVYVLFGKADTRTVDLASPGAGGYRIDGAAENDRAEEAANLGDVNGDGVPDLAIGAKNTDGGRGRAWVIFGKSDTAPIDLSADELYDAGFAINGTSRHEALGQSVVGPGDVNGDGLRDVAVGAPNASYNARGYSGSVYVVFGKRDGYDVELDGLGAGGFRVDGAATYVDGIDVEGAAGDVNADGLADLLVASPGATFAGRSRAGAASVVFGKRDGAGIDLGALGAQGFTIGGAHADTGVAGADGALDFNADGRADIVVGSYGDAGGGLPDAAYVVFGQPPPG